MGLADNTGGSAVLPGVGQNPSEAGRGRCHDAHSQSLAKAAVHLWALYCSHAREKSGKDRRLQVSHPSGSHRACWQSAETHFHFFQVFSASTWRSPLPQLVELLNGRLFQSSDKATVCSCSAWAGGNVPGQLGELCQFPFQEVEVKSCLDCLSEKLQSCSIHFAKP